jgi:hypothetical protein
LPAALTSAPQKTDTKIAKAAHLMHLDEGGGALYPVVINFLQAK